MMNPTPTPIRITDSSRPTFYSSAEWPYPAVSLGSTCNVSSDTHDTREAAQAVCDRLMREGFGGDGKIFPLRTWVSSSLDQPLAPTAIPDDETRGEPTVKNGEVPDGEIKQFDYRDSPYFAISPASPAPQPLLGETPDLDLLKRIDYLWDQLAKQGLELTAKERELAAMRVERNKLKADAIQFARDYQDLVGFLTGFPPPTPFQLHVAKQAEEIAAKISAAYEASYKENNDLRARLALQESALKDLRTQLDQVLTGDQEGNIPWHNERYGKLLLTLLATETLVAKMRAELIKAFEYLGREIQTLTLNDSAALGVQAMHRAIAEVLDLTPSSLRDALKDAQGEVEKAMADYDRVALENVHIRADLTTAQEENARLREQIENIEARGVHTCHANCQRPLCVAGREIRTLRTQLLAAKKDGERLREAITTAIDMHLGRCGSSEPFKAQDYRNHACAALDILRAALASPHDKREEGA